MACDVSLLHADVEDAIARSYTVCETDPASVGLSTEELQIIDSGNWCSWQDTYYTPVYPSMTDIINQVKNQVYSELWVNLQAELAAAGASYAGTYSTKIERQTDYESLAGQITAVAAQFNGSISALTTQTMTSISNATQALSQAITETEASFGANLTASTQFYQTSLASVNSTFAASGVLNSVDVNGQKVISGFRSEASAQTGSTFTIFADSFKILNRIPNDTGGFDYNEELTPFRVEDGVVYIGEVDTGTPQIVYIGEYANAPSSYAGKPLRENMTYKNTSNLNKYVYTNNVWVLYEEAYATYTLNGPHIVQVGNNGLVLIPSQTVQLMKQSATALMPVDNVYYSVSSNAPWDIPIIYGPKNDELLLSTQPYVDAGASTITIAAHLTSGATDAAVDVKVMSIVKDGQNGLTLSLSNENHSFAASSSGVIPTYAGSGTRITVFEGVDALTAVSGTLTNSTFKLVNTTVSNITCGTITPSGSALVVADHSNMTQDIATITYTIAAKKANGEEVTFSKVQSFSKARQGTDGARGAAQVLYSADLGSTSMGSYASNVHSLFTSVYNTPVYFDSIVVTNTNAANGWTATYYYNGSSWAPQALVVHGNAIVSGTLSAGKIVSESLSIVHSSSFPHTGNYYGTTTYLPAYRKALYMVSVTVTSDVGTGASVSLGVGGNNVGGPVTLGGSYTCFFHIDNTSSSSIPISWAISLSGGTTGSSTTTSLSFGVVHHGI